MVSTEKLYNWVLSLNSDDKDKLAKNLDQAIVVVSNIFGDSNFDRRVLETLLLSKEESQEKKIFIDGRRKEIQEEIVRLQSEYNALTSQLDAIILLNKSLQNTYENEVEKYKLAKQREIDEKVKASLVLKNAILNNERFTPQEFTELLKMTKPNANGKPKRSIKVNKV